MILYHTNERIYEMYASRKGGMVNKDKIMSEVEQELLASPYAFATIPEHFYNNALYYMKLNIDDDIASDINDLTSVYQTMKQEGDPRSEQVLAQIMAKRGKSLAYIAGPKPTMTPTPVAPNESAPAPVTP